MLNTKLTGQDLGCDKDKTHVCLTFKIMENEECERRTVAVGKW